MSGGQRRGRTTAYALYCSALAWLLWPAITLAGPYPPGAGQVGSDAIIKTSPSIAAWASGFTELTRGPLDTANPVGGNASFGTAAQALGPADADVSSANVVSLGDGGHMTLTFDKPIANGAGPDFAVFENGFSAGVGSDFLELAFVDVSSNGTNFFRFHSSSLTQTATQVASFGTLDPTNLNNLAGKYGAGYGTPFDLDELKNTSALLDVNNIRYVRITDVIGNIDKTLGAGTYSLDGDGNVINDPYPSAFSSGGFDLDAVGVMNQSTTPEPGGLAIIGVAMLLFLRRHRSVRSCSLSPVLGGEGRGAEQDLACSKGISSSSAALPLTLSPGYKGEGTSRWGFMALLAIAFFATPGFGAVVSTLEDVAVNSRADYYNGTTAAPGPNGPANSPNFVSAGFTYRGINSDYGDGLVASKHTDTTNHQPNSFNFQYEAITGKGAGGSATYAVASDFFSVRVDLPAGASPQSVQLTNSSYDYYTMLNGDAAFNTAAFGQGSWFKVTISGLSGVGQAIGTPVDYYLADFRSTTVANHFISNTWGTADLTPLTGASSLLFSLSSSDTDPVFGMNTPAYFAMDNLTATPEPGGGCLIVLAVCGALSRRRIQAN